MDVQCSMIVENSRITKCPTQIADFKKRSNNSFSYLKPPFPNIPSPTPNDATAPSFTPNPSKLSGQPQAGRRPFPFSDHRAASPSSPSSPFPAPARPSAHSPTPPPSSLRWRPRAQPTPRRRASSRRSRRCSCRRRSCSPGQTPPSPRASPARPRHRRHRARSRSRCSDSEGAPQTNGGLSSPRSNRRRNSLLCREMRNERVLHRRIARWHRLWLLLWLPRIPLHARCRPSHLHHLHALLHRHLRHQLLPSLNHQMHYQMHWHRNQSWQHQQSEPQR